MRKLTAENGTTKLGSAIHTFDFQIHLSTYLFRHKCRCINCMANSSNQKVRKKLHSHYKNSLWISDSKLHSHFVRIQVIITCSLLQMRIKEFIYRISVPLLNGKRFLDIPITANHFHNRIQSTNVFDLKIWILSRSIAFDEGLNLRIRTEFTCTHFQHSLGVAFR